MAPLVNHITPCVKSRDRGTRRLRHAGAMACDCQQRRDPGVAWSRMVGLSHTLRRYCARWTHEPSENCEQGVKGRPPKNTIGKHQEPFCHTGTLDTQDMRHPEERKPKDVHG